MVNTFPSVFADDLSSNRFSPSNMIDTGVRFADLYIIHISNAAVSKFMVVESKNISGKYSRISEMYLRSQNQGAYKIRNKI